MAFTVLLAAPRGFCAGVERAIRTVELALDNRAPGEAPDQVRLIQTIADASRVEVPDEGRVAYATQTTLSLDDVSAIVDTLRARFPSMVGPESGDVCYATQNRQEAVLALVSQHGAEVVLVLGSPNSSNSNR